MKPYQNMRQKLVHLKNIASKMERSNVVYCNPCTDCPVTLVDETRRLAKRVDEYRRAIQKVAVKVSTLAKHAWKSNHRVDWGQAASWTTVCARLYD